jgi:tetratricopeptide (TPR) repeat protein
MTGLALGALVATPVAATEERGPIVVEDPHYGDVLFHFYSEDYFAAIVRLLALRETGKLESHLIESEVLLGGLYLNYGHHLEAAEIFERVLADNVDPEIRDRTWFFLAKIWQQRGYLDRAATALASIEGTLPDNLEREAEMIEAEIYIATGEFDRAIALLSEWEGETEWSRYAQFNLGVALVRSGRIAEAERILSDLGSIDPWTEELTSLRDKANLALGYALLQDGRPLAAKAPLSRVRLEGPFSNKALLGVGWADAQLDNYQRALVPWMELRGRDLLDSAVQESMLAIPFALGKLDAVSQAADHYLNAIEAFYEETNSIDATIGRIESGAFLEEFVTDEPLDSSGWYWEMERLPEGPEARYLFHLLSTHEFQEGLKNYRDLNYLYQNLDSWQRNVDVFRTMLETRREAFETRLPRVQDALGRADIDDLVDRKLEYDSVLNDIEQSDDWLALSSEEQFDMWGTVTGLEANPALGVDTAEAAEVRNKIKLIKGVLQWELEREFKDKLWKLRREVRQTGEALVETQRSRREVDQSMRDEPLDFEALEVRVDGLASRVEGMQMRVADAMGAQRTYLQRIAVGELTAQKQRLDTYSVQARFALASIYDRAAAISEATE